MKYPNGKTNYVKKNITHEAYISKVTGLWTISKGSFIFKNPLVDTAYGTKRISAIKIIEKILNSSTIAIYDSVKIPGQKKTSRIFNKDETTLALQKAEELEDAFKKWCNSNSKKKEDLEECYNEHFGYIVSRKYNGSFLTFPGMNEDIHLFDYQKNAVARILFSNNTLLAHDVGAGKTYVMIASMMEMKRMGLSNKNLVVVPNNIVSQWRSDAKTLYPSSNVLCIEPKDFKPNNKQETLAKMKDNDYDFIVIPYSCFDLIDIGYQYYIDETEAQIDCLNAQITNEKSNFGGLERTKKKLEEKLNDYKYKLSSEDQGITFDQLGINHLYVDEAHNYKNLSITTKMDNVLGINSKGSKKCDDMLNKIRIVQRDNLGGGVTLATGTPITNSLTDVYVLQTYLQSAALSLMDLSAFDSWASFFGEKIEEVEVDVDTNAFRVCTRFAKFHNLPELTNLLSTVSDFHNIDDAKVLPIFNGYTDVVVDKNLPLSDYLKDISKRVDNIRNRKVSRQEDNMLKVTVDGRKAALDIRLVEPKHSLNRDFKVYKCAYTVADIYHKTSDDRLTQLVFSDISTPQDGFNVYDELKDLLINMGVNPNEIAYIHDANTDKQREVLFKNVQSGNIRVLIGSTFKLGLGVLIAAPKSKITSMLIPKIMNVFSKNKKSEDNCLNREDFKNMLDKTLNNYGVEKECY